MLEPNHLEELICTTATMDRETVTQALLEFHGKFPVDFTLEFLSKLSLERLRHIYVALCMQTGHREAAMA